MPTISVTLTVNTVSALGLSGTFATDREVNSIISAGYSASGKGAVRVKLARMRLRLKNGRPACAAVVAAHRLREQGSDIAKQSSLSLSVAGDPRASRRGRRRGEPGALFG
jgi:hypothetical protein